MNPTQDLLQLLNTAEIPVTKKQIDLLLQYKSALLNWNETTNLISKNTIADFDRIHLLDCLLPLKWLPELGPLIDLGTGGGLPGIAIKILRPDLEVTLSETRNRKIKFLQSAVTTLNLEGLGIINPSREKPEKKYRILVSRAFGPLSKIIRESKKYLTDDGTIFAYKGKLETIAEELESLPKNWGHEIRGYPGPEDIVNPERENQTERNIVFLQKRS